MPPAADTAGRHRADRVPGTTPGRDPRGRRMSFTESAARYRL